MSHGHGHGGGLGGSGLPIDTALLAADGGIGDTDFGWEHPHAAYPPIHHVHGQWAQFGVAPPPPPPPQGGYPAAPGAPAPPYSGGIAPPPPPGSPLSTAPSLYSDPALPYTPAPAAPPPQSPAAAYQNDGNIQQLQQQCQQLKWQLQQATGPQRAAIKAQLEICKQQLKAAGDMKKHHGKHHHHTGGGQQYPGGGSPQDPGAIMPPGAYGGGMLPGSLPGPWNTGGYQPPTAIGLYGQGGGSYSGGVFIPSGGGGYPGGYNDHGGYPGGGYPGGSYQPPVKKGGLQVGSAQLHGDIPGPGGGYHTHGELGFSQKQFG